MIRRVDHVSPFEILYSSRRNYDSCSDPGPCVLLLRRRRRRCGVYLHSTRHCSLHHFHMLNSILFLPSTQTIEPDCRSHNGSMAYTNLRVRDHAHYYPPPPIRHTSPQNDFPARVILRVVVFQILDYQDTQGAADVDVAWTCDDGSDLPWEGDHDFPLRHSPSGPNIGGAGGVRALRRCKRSLDIIRPRSQ